MAANVQITRYGYHGLTDIALSAIKEAVLSVLEDTDADKKLANLDFGLAHVDGPYEDSPDKSLIDISLVASSVPSNLRKTWEAQSENIGRAVETALSVTPLSEDFIQTSVKRNPGPTYVSRGPHPEIEM